MKGRELMPRAITQTDWEQSVDIALSGKCVVHPWAAKM